MKLLPRITIFLWLIGLFIVIWMFIDAASVQHHFTIIELVSGTIFAIISVRMYARQKKNPPINKESKQKSKLLNYAWLVKLIIVIIASLTILGRYIQDKNIEQCNDISHAETELKACNALITSGVSDPIVYMKRAIAKINTGKLDQALDDINRSLIIKPNYSTFLAIRGTIYISQGRYNDAIRDLDQSMQFQISNNNNVISNIFFLRGMAKFYADSPAASIYDLVNAIQKTPTGDSIGMEVIWLHLAKMRSGQNDQQEFAHNSNLVPAYKWPAPLIDLYLDKSTVEEVFAKAKSGDVSKQSDQLCDANFYTAELYLLRNKKTDARSLFQAAEDICPKQAAEGSSFAKAELMALENNASQPESVTPSAIELQKP